MTQYILTTYLCTTKNIFIFYNFPKFAIVVKFRFIPSVIALKETCLDRNQKVLGNHLFGSNWCKRQKPKPAIFTLLGKLIRQSVFSASYCWICTGANCKQTELINSELRNRNQCDSIEERSYLNNNINKNNLLRLLFQKIMLFA